MDIIRKLKSALISSGLTEKEIAFYVQVLKKPQSSVFDIAKKTKISKDIAYYIYDSLEEKGLVASASNGRSKKVISKNADVFIENLYSQGRKFYKAGDSMKEVRSMLPYLSMSDNIGSIEVLNCEEVGEEWVNFSYINWESVLAYGNFELLMDRMTVDSDREFMKNRIKRGKRAYPLLIDPSPYSKTMIDSDQREMRKTKVIDAPELKDSFALVFPDKNMVAIWSRDKNNILSGIKVENPVLARMHEQAFRHFDAISEGISS